LPEKKYSGYIFDLDGTLVDSMPVHYKAWRWALREHGAPEHVFRWHEFVAHGGMAAPDIVADLNAVYGLNMEPETVAEDKRNRYAWLLLNEQLPVIQETIQLVRQLKEQGIPYAIGTGSMPSGAMETLQSAGVADLFSIMVTPADVPPGFGKPRPDIFLLCAEKMGVNPRECVVFEDAEPGIQAALAGGMDYVRVGECPPVLD
jgi:HAD superfamily hydrolase (TIGR01509 family)